MGSLSLLQGIFPTQGLNPGLPRCRHILYQLSHKGSPKILEWVAYFFSRRSSQPGMESGSPALQADSLPAELLGKSILCLPETKPPGPPPSPPSFLLPTLPWNVLALGRGGCIRAWVLGTGDPEVRVDGNLLPHQVSHSPCPWLTSLWRSQESKLVAFYSSSRYSSVSLAKS